MNFRSATNSSSSAFGLRPQTSADDLDAAQIEADRSAAKWLALVVIAVGVITCWLVAPRSFAAPIEATSSQCLHPSPEQHGGELLGQTLDIDVLGLHRCAVGGGQAELDEGLVVRVDELSTEMVDWVTGHRTSHGATFSSLTGLQIGDRVEFDGSTYLVAEYRLVNRHAPAEVSTWMESDTPSLVLQTSATSPYVHVWRAAVVEPSSL